jgi:hypothetical protein
LILLLAFMAGGMRADVEDWLKSVAALPVPEYKNAPPAVILLDDYSIEIDAHGRAETTHRWAVRILHLSARSLADGSVRYNGKSDKVSYAEAWLWRKGEVVKWVKQREWVDFSDGDAGSVIDEMRKKIAFCSSNAVVGDVYAIETRVKGPINVAQFRFDFGEPLPALTQRLSVVLPAGFQFRAQLFGEKQPSVNRSADGLSCSWTATDRPYRPEEPLPGRGAWVDARLFVSIEPPASATRFEPKCFGAWNEVATWVEQLNEDSFDTSPALAAKARELTASCSDTLSKIRAIAGYVQGTRYIGINRGLALGLGFKARKASDVFSTGFGDCKDKANLLRAMLREIGIHAHMASALIDNDFDVRPECPTPAQFNHAIAAIDVDPTVVLPSVVQVDKLGRLLLFDPTSEHTLVGDLPAYLQGSRVLILSRGSVNLVDVPDLDRETGFKVVRKAGVVLLPNGAVSVAGRIEGYGHAGARLRALIKEADVPKKLEELATGQLSDGFKGALIQEKRTEDDRITGRCSLSFTCVNRGFVQQLSGGLSVIKLDVLSRQNMPVLPEKERHLPVRLRPLSLEDEITLHIPAGQKVEELPPAATIESPYGRYQISFEVVGDAVVAHRKIAFNKIEIPAEDYTKLKGFLGQIVRADRCSVILKKGG